MIKHFFLLDSFLGTDTAKSRVLGVKEDSDDKDTWSPVAFSPELSVTVRLVR